MKDKLARDILNMLEQRTNLIESALRDMQIFVSPLHFKNEIIDKSARNKLDDLENKLNMLMDHLGLQFEEVKKHTEIKVKEEQK